MWEWSSSFILNYTHWENRGLLYHSHCLHTVLEQSGIKLMSSRKRNLSSSWLQNCIHNSNRTSYNLKHMANKLWHIAESNLTEQATFTFLMKVTITPGVDVILDLGTNLNHTWTSLLLFQKHYANYALLFVCFFQIGLKFNTAYCYFSFCLQVIYSYKLIQEKNIMNVYTVKFQFTLRSS